MTYRVSLTVLNIVGGCMLIAWVFIGNSVDMLYQAGKNESKHIVQVALNSITPLIEKQRAGELSREEALNKALKMLRKMTYVDQFGDNYIFMSSYDGTMLVQPFEPELQGSDQWDLKDDRGKYIVRELAKKAREEGEGYVEYFYKPPGREEVQRKISYVVGIPDWEVYLGTGMHTEDVDQFYSNSLKMAISITVVLAVTTALTSVLLLRPVLQCYRRLQSMFQQIWQQPDALLKHVPNPFRKGSNEWQMMDSFGNMLKELSGSRKRLRRRQNELEHLSRVASLGEMVGVIAHEINQPLAAIGNNAAAAKNILSSGKVDTDQIMEILQDIIADNKRASEVIRSIRTMLVKGEYQMSAINIADLTLDALRFIQALFSSFNFSLVPDLSDDPAIVKGNWVQLQQVIVNLVINAIEHLPENGSGRILIRSQITPSREVEISVIDNGTGMAANSMDKLFQPFFSLKKDGMGMGLAISRTIIEAHQGTIQGHSNPDQGMTFTIKLPLVNGVS